MVVVFYIDFVISDVQQNKFIQLYQIKKSEQITFEAAVLELVELVQTGLLFFGLFPKQHIDGLLCDTTQNALATFKTKFAHILQVREYVLKKSNQKKSNCEKKFIKISISLD